ncbi:MAG: hypothetical protein HOV81_40240 [Kofleriaceae bacterium]|nr:hypothetical protein [Kofleriaceae bacterium]
MISKSKLLAAALLLAVPLAGAGCDSGQDKVERWATTENTNVQIDWNKVNEAYKAASGPEDLERRINEIYEGDEVISIAVQDEGDKTQVVTGFFDKNHDGKVDDAEKIFTIKREPTAEGTAQIQTTGYGPYYGYHSPILTIASGMILGSMISNMFMPSYMPVRYVTSSARIGDLHSHRSSYRASNPERFGPRSKSGRVYGGGKTTKPSGGFGRSRGGGRFGLRRAGRTVRPARLSA